MRAFQIRRSLDPVVKRIIILSQARSGSTLLQRILHCCIPDANINGENHDFWGHISESYYAWERTCQRPEAAKTYTREDLFKPCWWNEYKLRDLLKSHRRLFDDMYQARSHRVIGFKEVRMPSTVAGLSRYVAFFRKMFPTCLIIFTYRDINDIVKSGWWSEADRDNLLRQENVMCEFYQNNKDYTYMISYKEIMNSDKMHKLFSFIREPLETSKYHAVIQKVYS